MRVVGGWGVVVVRLQRLQLSGQNLVGFWFDECDVIWFLNESGRDPTVSADCYESHSLKRVWSVFVCVGVGCSWLWFYYPVAFGISWSLNHHADVIFAQWRRIPALLWLALQEAVVTNDWLHLSTYLLLEGVFLLKTLRGLLWGGFGFCMGCTTN